MTGAEAVVLGFILAAFVIFGTTLAWVSSNSSNRRRRSPFSAANDEAGRLIAQRTAARQLSTTVEFTYLRIISLGSMLDCSERASERSECL
jgi:hypothetical protein